jgi:AraC family transcriptional regulator of adaptative response/methylated-DNA-[protein]-cysteine methyltransferase
MSTFHFHRTFKSLTGITPKQYSVAQRAHRVRETLPQTETVTEAIYKSGFKSNGRFYAEARQTLGMTPTQFRNGGADMIIAFTIRRCSLGRVLVAASDRGICAIFLDDNPDSLTRALARQFPNAQLVRGDAQFDQTVARVIAFIELPATGFCLPLDIRGTLFQQKVWEALRAIPPGTTVSYAELAQRLGVPKAVRAVARACAANTIAVAVPCHRVVRHDGTLSGYRWGPERKRALLAREARSP